MTADFPDWMPPAQQMLEAYFGVTQQIAALIATGDPNGAPGGVPLLAQPEKLYSTTNNLNVPAGATHQPLPDDAATDYQPMAAYLSYELNLQATSNAASAAPFLTIQLNWLADASATTLLYSETWVCPVNSAGTRQITATGPVRGAYLEVLYSNNDGTNAMTLNKFTLFGNSRPAPESLSDWRDTSVTAAMPGYNTVTYGANSDGLLGVIAATVPAATTNTYVCGMYNGTAHIAVSATGTSLNAQVQTDAWVSLVGQHPVSEWHAVTAADPTAEFDITSPRGPVILKVQNLSATNAATFDIAVVAGVR